MDYFNKLYSLTNEPFESFFVKVVSLIKEISLLWNGYIEDLEGAKDLPELRYGIILLFIESIMEMEILIDNNYNKMVSKEHFLSMALEDGFSNAFKCSGKDVIDIFKLFDVESGSGEIIEYCKNMVEGLSEGIPNPMVAKGSSDYIKVLREWVRVIRQSEISPELIEDLVLRK